MKTQILTKKQLLFLKLFSKSGLNTKFYLSGGTALAEFYIPYRLSDDLDFFSLDEVVTEEIMIFLKQNKSLLGYESYEFNTSFNRNLFFLKFSDQILKTEFTYYPFTQIEKPIDHGGVLVDSLLDIAANKLFTIYQKPRARDFIDLYMTCLKTGWQINDLIKKTKIKFDVHIDPIKLGSQFLLCTELGDYPKLLIDLENDEWQNFFLNEAKEIGKEII